MTQTEQERAQALAEKHGATSYRNRADTQNPAYGFTPIQLAALIAEVEQAARRAPAVPVPHGWVAIPLEPTAEEWQQAQGTLLDVNWDAVTCLAARIQTLISITRDKWSAAVAAAPQAPAPKWDGVINPSDFIVNTFSQGSSGWIQKPDNCVRITHVPTGLFEEETADRSVHGNKAVAWERLCARLEALAAHHIRQNQP